MPRLCIVARSQLVLYGYLLVALERELLDDRMRIIFDRRQPASSPGGAAPGVERRTHPAVEEVLRTQGYVIVDENGDVAAPAKRPAWREAARLGTSAAGWAGERVRSTWQARPATGTVVKLAGVLGALAISAVLVAVVLRGAESPMPSAPTQTTMVAGPPTVAAPPAPVVGPPEPEAGSLALGASTPEPAVLASAPKDRPPAPPPSTRSRAAALRPAAASVTTPARMSAPTRAKPTVVLETDPQGKGNQRSITYTASVLDAGGQPLTNAEVWLLAWVPPDGSDLKAPLGPTDTPGTYQGRVEVGVFTPGNLRVRIAHGERSFDIAPQHRQR